MSLRGKNLLQIVSDLHIDHNVNYPIVPRAPNLALLGDIGMLTKYNNSIDDYSRYLNKQARQFDNVFVVLGNHEYYGLTRDETIKRAQHICDNNSKLHLMQFNPLNRNNTKSFKIANTRIIGTTLWSKVPPIYINEVQRRVGNYSRVLAVLSEPAFHATRHPPKNVNSEYQRLTISVNDTNMWFEEERSWIASQIDDAKNKREKIVVLTHYAPIFDAANPKYAGKPIETAFCTDLRYMMGQPLILWAFGHTHWYKDVNIGGTRVLTNALGYTQKYYKWNPELVVEI